MNVICEVQDLLECGFEHLLHVPRVDVEWWRRKGLEHIPGIEACAFYVLVVDSTLGILFQNSIVWSLLEM